ncbi:DNA-binding transcriptional regulator, MarR family [Flavobacterium fontis]|uniref:DNA-binding transcriptional regulator, MarR family n=1 Tax=Flavobacterium fontis TaxID=1124188 RepID=A0A1M4ZX94_9FLAO|nr:MarR family winged helix-turn-helix transcriptional regulator [Flavobacterium fontis]SHF22608.1 DNA-binding transcriptional regulator, MarR family [Flavobacterium fontis]
MKAPELLHHLLDDFFEFTQGDSGITTFTPQAFAAFLQIKYRESQPIGPLMQSDFEQPDLVMENENEDKRDLLILLTYLFKYARLYIKKALVHSKIQTVDEFAFLINLIMTPDLTKSALFAKTITEKTSGTEIIKRLRERGLVEEYKNEINKKNVYLRLTPLGKSELLQVMPNMQLVTEIVSGTLSEFELKFMHQVLTKLEKMHNSIYLDDRDDNLEQIHQKVIS